jgi:hypothetical protein
MAKKKSKPKPLSKWAKGALKRINETFPSKEESTHPFVVFTRLLVLAKDCGIDVSHGDRSAIEPTVNVMATLRRAGFTVIEGGSKD